MPKISVEHFQNYKLAVKMHILRSARQCPHSPVLSYIFMNVDKQGRVLPRVVSTSPRF